MGLAEKLDVPRDMKSSTYASLFGRFQLWAPDGNEVVISSRRARALLAMLCLVPDETIERDYLSKLLWPGRFEAHAKASLRQCLLDLGKLLDPLGCEMVKVARNRIGLNPAAIRTDLGALELALQRGDYTSASEKMAAIGAAPLLDQMDFGDAFGAWLADHRAKVERRLRTMVESALATLERAGETDLHARLLDGWSARTPSLRNAAMMGRPTGKTPIAVLPFRPLGMNADQYYFSDGIVDELITMLGQVPQLRVVGRTSSFHFRDSDMALPEIAAALLVSHLIEGSVQRQGEQVRIHVHLIDGDTGFELWSHRYDGTLDNIFTLQEMVAQAVTAAIGAALDIAMEAPLVRGMTQSKAAYDLYLQGRSLCNRVFSDGVLRTAIDFLEQAVALDPEFAEAWVALAEAHQLVAIYTPCMDRAAESARMAECAQRALEIAPDTGYAYSLLGVHQWTQNDIVGALDLAFKAYHLEPGNPAVAMRLGSFLLYCGRTTEAMKYVEAAIDVDPVDGRKFALRAVGRLNQGDHAGAIEAGQRMVDLGFPSMWQAAAMAASGQHEQAVEQYQQTRLLMNTTMSPPAGIGPMPPEVMDAYWLMAAKGVCSGNEQDRENYCRVLDMHFATLHDPADPLIVLPAIFMGYAEMVFKSVGTRITPANTLCLLSLWADVDPIRRTWQHPEFITFAQRIGMAAMWDKYGWPDLLPPPSNRPAPG